MGSKLSRPQKSERRLAERQANWEKSKQASDTESQRKTFTKKPGSRNPHKRRG